MYEIYLENFDIKKIAESGQCFRMHKVAYNKYIAIATDRMVVIEQDGKRVRFDCSEHDFFSFWERYFDLRSDAYGTAKRECYFMGIVDTFGLHAARYSDGIRILRQDLWEMVVSYLIARCKKIEQISVCIEKMCRKYGRVIGTYDGELYYSFPSPYSIAKRGLKPLLQCGMGFRARDIWHISKMTINGEFRLDYLRQLSYETGFEYLTGKHKEEVKGKKVWVKNFKGIGAKVANCILLYGCHHVNSVPRDTWINKVVEENYSGSEPWWFKHPYAGIIQQYVFFYKRTINKKGANNGEH